MGSSYGSIKDFCDWLNGDLQRPRCTLQDCIPFVRLNRDLYDAASIVEKVDTDGWQAYQTTDGEQGRALIGLSERVDTFLRADT